MFQKYKKAIVSIKQLEDFSTIFFMSYKQLWWMRVLHICTFFYVISEIDVNIALVSHKANDSSVKCAARKTNSPPYATFSFVYNRVRGKYTDVWREDHIKF